MAITVLDWRRENAYGAPSAHADQKELNTQIIN
jgi:hypothetical protein